jgi:hypothetical protein
VGQARGVDTQASFDLQLHPSAPERPRRGTAAEPARRAFRASVEAWRLKAKELVKQQLGAPGWLCGVGLGGERGDYCVKVNVTSLDEVTEPCPRRSAQSPSSSRRSDRSDDSPPRAEPRPNPAPCVAGSPGASRPHPPRSRDDPSTVHTRPNPAPCVAGSPVASRPHPPGLPPATPRPCTRDRTPHPASQGCPLVRDRTRPRSRDDASTVHTRPNPPPCVARSPVTSRPHPPGLPRRPLNRPHATEPRTLRRRVGA